jgi:hypothetical protein
MSVEAGVGAVTTLLMLVVVATTTLLLLTVVVDSPPLLVAVATKPSMLACSGVASVERAVLHEMLLGAHKATVERTVGAVVVFRSTAEDDDEVAAIGVDLFHLTTHPFGGAMAP